MDEGDNFGHVRVYPDRRPKCAPSLCDANHPCQIDRTEMSPIEADSEGQPPLSIRPEVWNS
jgi:hypothetical protein